MIEPDVKAQLPVAPRTFAILLALAEEPSRFPPKVHVHSANPVARDYMLGMIERYKPCFHEK